MRGNARRCGCTTIWRNGSRFGWGCCCFSCSRPWLSSSCRTDRIFKTSGPGVTAERGRRGLGCANTPSREGVPRMTRTGRIHAFPPPRARGGTESSRQAHLPSGCPFDLVSLGCLSGSRSGYCRRIGIMISVYTRPITSPSPSRISDRSSESSICRVSSDALKN